MHVLWQGKSICLYNKHEAPSKRDGVAGGNILPHQGYHGPLVFPPFSKDHSGCSACGMVTDFLPRLFDSGKYHFAWSSLCQVIAKSRQGIKQLGGFFLFYFPLKVARGDPHPCLLMTARFVSLRESHYWAKERKVSKKATISHTKGTPNDTGFLHQIVYEWLHNPCDTGSFLT